MDDSSIFDKLHGSMPAYTPNASNGKSVVYPEPDMFDKKGKLDLNGYIRDIKAVGSDTKVAIEIVNSDATVLDVFANRSSDQFFRACNAGGHSTLTKLSHVEAVLGRACAIKLSLNDKRSIGYDVDQIRIDTSKATQPVIEPASDEQDEDLPF